MRRVLLTGRYSGDSMQASVPERDGLVRDVRSGALDAQQLLERYCRMLYNETDNYEEVARRTGLDRRTIKKYVLAT